MKLGYINPMTTAAELMQQIEQQKSLGVTIENITINKSFAEFVANLPNNCTIVIPSYGSVFSGLSQLLSTLITLYKKGIFIESATEPMICPPNGKIEQLELIHLITPTLNKTKTTGDQTAAIAKRGRPLGSTKTSNKVAEVDKIRQKLNISIEKACRMVGCQPRTYYRHKARE